MNATGSTTPLTFALSVAAVTVTLAVLLLFANTAVLAQDDPFGENAATPPPPHTPKPPPTPPPTSPPARIDFFFENDGTFFQPIDNTDRHYTNGFKLALSYNPHWADKLARALPLANHFPDIETAGGFVFGHEIYTPEDIIAPVPDPDDHPYTAYVYAGAFVQRADHHLGLFEHLELNVGFIGPSALGDEIQSEVHRIINDDLPQGWDSQTRDELGFNLIYQRKWKIKLTDNNADGIHDTAAIPDYLAFLAPLQNLTDNALQIELIPQAGFTLGTFTRQANINATLRVGTNLPQDFGPARLRDLGDATRIPRHSPYSIYGYITLSAFLVEQNTFAEGNNYNKSSEDPGVSINPLYGDITLGFAVAWKNYRVGYSQTYQTEFFEGQNGGDSFGAINLSATFPF